MDHLIDQPITFIHWNFCSKKLMQWWATVHFVLQVEALFHEIFKIFVVISQKLFDEWS